MSATIQEFDFSVDLLRALLWRHDDAEHLQSILTQKNQWYLENETEFWDNWFTDVFNLQTANDFGCSVWALILGVPLNLIVASNQGPQFGYGALAYTTPYNIAPVSDQPVTAASVTSVRRAGGWQGDRPLFATARTNFLLQSEGLSTATWTKTAGTLTPNVVNAPSGASNGSKFVPTTANSQHGLTQAALSYTNGTTYTHAVFAKSAGVRGIFLNLADAVFGANSHASFDFATGLCYTGDGTSSATMTPYPDGWFLCTWSMACIATNASSNVNIYTAANPVGAVFANTTYAGDGVSGVYLWGAQAEARASYSTYIPTTTVAVTVTDYTIATNGVMTFAVAPGSVGTDQIYVNGQYTSGSVRTLTNALLARAWTNNHRYNFNRGNFGTSQAGVGLTLAQKRILLQLQYYKLISRCTVPEINERVSAILGEQGSVYVLDSNNMQYITYVFGFQPNSALQFILENFDVLPRPAGVGVRFIISTRPAFGFGSFNKNFNNGTFWAEN